MVPDLSSLKCNQCPLHVHGIDAADVVRIVGAIGTGVLILDGRGKVLLANDQASSIIRRPLDDLIGQRVDELLMPLTEIEAHAMAKDGRREARAFTQPDGRKVELGFRATRIAAPAGDQADAAYVLVFQDDTSIERLRREHDRLMQLAAVSDVLPSVMHELKNPLAAITSAVELVLDELGEGPVRDDLQSVLGEIRRMKLTLEGIGSVGRELVSGRPTAIDFAITEAFHVLLRPGTSRGIAMECHVPAMPLLPFDPSVLRAIVFNLIQNAIHACESGGCTIRLSAEFQREQQRLELRISDTGQGMSEEVVASCTDLFFTTKAHGSGIGLALVVRAVEGAGGQLCVQSVEGRGTDIRIILPVPEPGTRRAQGETIH